MSKIFFTRKMATTLIAGSAILATTVSTMLIIDAADRTNNSGIGPTGATGPTGPLPPLVRATVPFYFATVTGTTLTQIGSTGTLHYYSSGPKIYLGQFGDPVLPRQSGNTNKLKLVIPNPISPILFGTIIRLGRVEGVTIPLNALLTGQRGLNNNVFDLGYTTPTGIYSFINPQDNIVASGARLEFMIVNTV